MTDTLVKPDSEGTMRSTNYVDLGSRLEGEFNKSAKGGSEKKSGAWSTGKAANGTAVLNRERMPVFRSGEFSDSMGRRNKWIATHMRQMVDHFELLKENDQFSDVPVRRGHGSLFGDPIDSLIGYVTNLSMERRTSPVDGKEYDYLLADVEIIDTDSQEKIQSGLWRNLSSEIGMYIDNDEAEYWPVFKGFAYVDIPAVEGLKEYSASHTSNRTIIEGETMTDSKTPVAPKVESSHGAKSENFVFTINGEGTTDFSKVQAYVKKVEAENVELSTTVGSLSEFKKESITRERDSYVDALAKDGKIVQSSVEQAKAFAKGMSDDQFKMYKEMNDQSDALPIMGDHGVQQDAPVGSHPNAGGINADEAKEGRVEILKEIVSAHSSGNRPVAEIKELPSYKELLALEPSFQLSR